MQFDKTSSDFDNPDISALKACWPRAVIAEKYDCLNYYMDLHSSTVCVASSSILTACSNYRSTKSADTGSFQVSASCQESESPLP